MNNTSAFFNLTIAQRREYSAARLWCILTSAAAFVIWSLSLQIIALAILAPPDPNPYGLGLFLLAPFVLAIPFGALNSLSIFSMMLNRNKYDFNTSKRYSTVAFVIVSVIALVWFLTIRKNPTLWQYTGFAWILWAVFAPPAFGGSALVSHLFRSKI